MRAYRSPSAPQANGRPSAHRFVKRAHMLCATEGLGRAAARLGRMPRTDAREGT
jgi:hypothetical protein